MLRKISLLFKNSLQRKHAGDRSKSSSICICDKEEAIMKREPNFENRGFNNLFQSGIIVN